MLNADGTWFIKIGMTFADDGQCMLVVEVEEHHSDLVDQMCE